MKNVIKLVLATAFFAVLFFSNATAQVGGNTFGAGDGNLGDLDQLEQSVSVSINLETILQLHGPDNAAVAFIFDEMEEFRKGIKAEDPTNGGAYVSAGVTNGIQKFGVDATVNWKLDWRADLPTDYVSGANTGDNRDQRLSLNNIGAIFSTDGAGTKILPTDRGAVALTNSDFTVIKRADGASNIGDADKNIFSLAWRVGTQEKPAQTTTPAMNSQSLLEQQIGSEAYKFAVVFTLSQDDPWIQ